MSHLNQRVGAIRWIATGLARPRTQLLHARGCDIKGAQILLCVSYTKHSPAQGGNLAPARPVSLSVDVTSLSRAHKVTFMKLLCFVFLKMIIRKKASRALQEDRPSHQFPLTWDKLTLPTLHIGS
jgi:hypothetical protein